MFNFFKRRKGNKKECNEPKRPPRKCESMGVNQSNSKLIPVDDVYKTPPSSPALKQQKVLTVDNRTVPTKIIGNSSGSSGGDIVLDESDEYDNSKASLPNNVNNVLSSRSPRVSTTTTSITEMGNNISKLEDVEISETPGTSLESDLTNTIAEVPNEQHVSNKNTIIKDTTNKRETNISNRANSFDNLKEKHSITDKTEIPILVLNKSNAFLTDKSNNLISDNVSETETVNIKTETNDTNLGCTKNITQTDDQQKPNISTLKNSVVNKITQSLTTTNKEKNGIEARLEPTYDTNINLENVSNNEGMVNVFNTDNSFINKVNKNSNESFSNDSIDRKSQCEIDQPIVLFINESNDAELKAIDTDESKKVLDNSNKVLDNGINVENLLEDEGEAEEEDEGEREETNTIVSLLVKETREVIIMADRDIKKCDTENITAPLTLDKQFYKQWQNSVTAVNQVVGEATTISEVKNDVKEYSASDTLGVTDVISCQQKKPVNNRPSTHREEDSLNKMLTIRTNSSGLETFSSSPPKVTDSETDEDNSTRVFLCKTKLNEKEKDAVIKLKKHVHWADSAGRTLESFEKCSSFEGDEADDVDDEEEEVLDENKNEETSSEDENEEESSGDDASSSSSEDDDDEETSQASKENIVEYKRQDTWLDVIDDLTKSDASDSKTNNDSGEEETSEEETSESGEEDDEEEDDAEDEDDDEEDEKEDSPTAQNDKTDSKMNEVNLDNSSLIPVHELYDKVTKLQEEIMIRASGLERQKAELEAAYLENESVKLKSKQLEDELHEYKSRNTELTIRTSNAESQLLSEGNKGKLKEAEKKISELESELENVKMEKERLEESIKKIERDRDQEVQIVRQALDRTINEQEEIELKYKKEFEQLRSLNSNREVQMLDDFEWKLREVERLGKKKLADTEKELQEKVRDLTTKLEKAEEEIAQVAHLKLCEIEVKQLRVTAHEHRKNLRTVTRQLEDLQVDEKILQEEVARLRAAVDKEKAQMITLQNSHKEELVEKERKTQFKLQFQKNQINTEWEDKLKRECSRLKSELERGFREEKMVAIETEKRIRDHELANFRKIWEQKLEDAKMEVSNYKKKLEDTEEQHKIELESAQTHSDRDVFDLRRKMDKLDMQYQEKIEKMQEVHDQEILTIKQECEKKIHQCESSVQMQLGTTRTTLELVKQQMANECELRIEQLKRLHHEQLEDQWDKLQLEKEAEIQQLEEGHRKAVELLENKLEEIKKRNERSEVSTHTANTNISKLFNSFMKLFHQVI